jgi:glycosyltransferase involved in cell wall biosynthesis
VRIGIVAPPWVAVPPPGYGGTELALDALARGLAARGNDVTLFATGDSTCAVDRAWLFDRADPERMGDGLIELRHAAAAYDALDGCDLVHDHTLVGPFLARRSPGPAVVTTIHGPFDDNLIDVYRRTAGTVPLIAISHDQAGRAPWDVPVAAVIHHGLDLDRYRFRPEGGEYLVALGRMSPDKGIDLAIDVARRSGVRLVIAAKMRLPAERRYFDEAVRPRLGPGVSYVGEAGHRRKVALLGGALALLNPIRWPEPFGLVMIESMACGTPVLSTAEGAAPEIVDHGTTGFLGATARELAGAVGAVADLDRRACRQAVADRFSMDRMAGDHERLYLRVLDRRAEAEAAAPAAAGRSEHLAGLLLPPLVSMW